MLNSTQIKELLIQASRCTNDSGYTHDIMPLVPQLIQAIESQEKAIESLCAMTLDEFALLKHKIRYGGSK